MILILDDDEVMGKCLIKMLKRREITGQLSNNVVDAIAQIEQQVPEMILMDVMLTGPDGFTLLNELASYPDTMNIPIVIISEKDFSKVNLSLYNVVGVLSKYTLRPEDVWEILDKCLENANKQVVKCLAGKEV